MLINAASIRASRMETNNNIMKSVNRLYPQASHGRGTGISTSLALRCISDAIATPNTWIVVIDHIDSPNTNKSLLLMCKALVTDMNLKFFTYEYQRNTGQARIRCDIFGGPL